MNIHKLLENSVRDTPWKGPYDIFSAYFVINHLYMILFSSFVALDNWDRFNTILRRNIYDTLCDIINERYA